MEKKEALKKAIKEIESQHGKGSISSLTKIKESDIIKTGSIHLDRALGIGGLPKGRIIEIYGNESSGKTTLTIQTIAQCQRDGGTCAFIDMENALDAGYCERNGINLDNLIVAKPSSGEQAFSVLESLVKTGMIDLIVVDSVAAMVPENELAGDFDNQNIGLHARLMSKGLRMIQKYINEYNVCVVFINQVREKVGIMFGDNKTTTGGWALKFFSSIRMDIRRSELIKEGDKCVGIRSNVRIIKNKLAPPLTSCYVDIYFDRGFDYSYELIDFAIEKGVIQKKGSWYSWNDINLAQGKEGLRKKIKSDKTLFEEVKEKSLSEMVIK